MNTNYMNYFLTSKNSRLVNGHLKSEELYQKILDHDGSTAYCCYFDLDYDYLKLEWDTGRVDAEGKKIYKYELSGQAVKDATCNGKTFTQYEGIARPSLNMVSFDFDSEDPQESLDDVRRFVEWIGEEDIAVFFSGSKGFHVMVPFGYFPLEPNEHLPNQLKDLAKHLKEFYPTLDDSIYNYNRKFRVPFTKHDKSGLFKVKIELSDVYSLEMDQIKELAMEDRAVLKEDFIFNNNLQENKERQPLEIFADAIEASKRKSYNIEKERGGTLEKATNFEKFDDKKCIKKMLASRCDDVGRNNACIRLINDFFRTQKTQAECEKIVGNWATENGLPLQEVSLIISNIYERGFNYNFGCQDEIKSAYCSGTCDIWSKLDIEKRPAVVDAPKNISTTKSEMDITKALLKEVFACKYDEVNNDFYDGLIVKQGEKDLFMYKNKHWQELDEALLDKLKRKINQCGGGKLSIKKIESTFRMVRTYIPNAEKDMYTPKTNAAAFNNGTLYLEEDSAGKFLLNFKSDHNPKDYLTVKFDFNYTHDSDANNEMFADMCDRIFKDDEDKEEKINAISEMFGAALMPYFPHLFFMCGKAQSGKSTFMLILNEMLNEEEHICSVQPKDWKGFHMEPMINKLVNMVTDVNTKKPIEDDVVKQIEDRALISINRKGKKMVRAPLPSLHIFAGNDFMKSEDGSSAAMERRWTIIRFNNIHQGKMMRNFATVCYRSNPQGVVNFALRGLRRLVDNQGFFTKFEASKTELKNWALESDVVEEFLKDIEVGEVEDMVLESSAKIKRPELYTEFFKWQEASGYSRSIIGKKTLFKSMSQKGYDLRKVRGSVYFKGIGSTNSVDNGTAQGSDEI